MFQPLRGTASALGVLVGLAIGLQHAGLLDPQRELATFTRLVADVGDAVERSRDRLRSVEVDPLQP